MNKSEIWVAGYPSFIGGADTELDHNIDLWRMNGVDVNLVPLGGIDPAMMELCKRRGCRTIGYEPNIFKDRVVVSFCNMEFLKRLPSIIEAGRPRCVIWFNCMMFLSGAERVAHGNGWIDRHGFASDFQRRRIKPLLEQIRPVCELAGYRPFFNPENMPQGIRFEYRAPSERFVMGRVSRDEAGKFSPDMWATFRAVQSPRPKKVIILGFGPNALRVCGAEPGDLDVETWPPNRLPVREVYRRLHCMIYKTAAFEESYGRVVVEAYAAGVPVVVEDKFAFPEMIIDGVTGFRCRSAEEMAARASELAFDEAKRGSIIFAAHRHLLEQLANPGECWRAWRAVLE